MAVSMFARLNHKHGRRVDRATRREFLRNTLLASGALMLSAHGYARAQQVGRGKRVVVIGAGFAGLAAAHELLSVGYDVTVIEARNRLGGRVLSFSGQTEYVPGRTVEGGAELIGSNHPCWVHYANKFELEFLDVTEEELEAPIYLDGAKLSEDDSNALWEEMDVLAKRSTAQAEGLNPLKPWESAQAREFDNTSTAEWIARQTDATERGRRGLKILLESDNGQVAEKMSYLGELSMIAGGGGERYWVESEVYRCKGGNQQLAFRLAEAIGARRIILGLPVSEITRQGNNMVIIARDGRRIECDDVIFTAPPSTWSKIKFNPALPATLAPQMGSNLKYLMRLKKRVWLENNLSQYALTDGFVAQTWDGTDNQLDEGDVCLNCFSGGPSSEASLAIPRDQRDAKYKEFLEKIYPGLSEAFVESRYMDWPRDQWAMAGYSFPAPGQITALGPVLHKGVGNLHFAGEHTSYGFIGYMEGGLNSGVQAARRLAQRDGLNIPEIPMPPPPKAEEEVEHQVIMPTTSTTQPTE